MSALTVTFAILFYIATAILIIFVARKIWIYKKTPAPLKIPTTPAPTTRTGVAFRMVKELTIFESLFKSTECSVYKLKNLKSTSHREKGRKKATTFCSIWVFFCVALCNNDTIFVRINVIRIESLVFH